MALDKCESCVTAEGVKRYPGDVVPMSCVAMGPLHFIYRALCYPCFRQTGEEASMEALNAQ